jgi:hypothetical protein
MFGSQVYGSGGYAVATVATVATVAVTVATVTVGLALALTVAITPPLFLIRI